MNKTMLTNALKAKFEITQYIINNLPENLQTPIKQVQRELIESFQEAIKSIFEETNTEMKTNTATEKSNGLTTIEIE